MNLSKERDCLVNMLKQTISLMCKSSLTFDAELSVEGLLGITLDKKEIFLVNINESVTSTVVDGTPEKTPEKDLELKRADSSYSAGPIKRHKGKRRSSTVESGVEADSQSQSKTRLTDPPASSSTFSGWSDPSALVLEPTSDLDDVVTVKQEKTGEDLDEISCDVNASHWPVVSQADYYAEASTSDPYGMARQETLSSLAFPGSNQSQFGLIGNISSDSSTSHSQLYASSMALALTVEEENKELPPDVCLEIINRAKEEIDRENISRSLFARVVLGRSVGVLQQLLNSSGIGYLRHLNYIDKFLKIPRNSRLTYYQFGQVRQERVEVEHCRSLTRKPRTYITPFAKQKMDSLFKVNQYIPGEEAEKLAQSLRLDRKTVLVYFQNKRFLQKKAAQENCATVTVKSSKSPANYDKS